MTTSTPICPACRFVRDVLAANPGRITFVPASTPVPEHLPNCPARGPASFQGMRVLTHIELPDAPATEEE